MVRRNCSKSALVKGGDDASDLAFFFFRSTLLGAISISSLASLEAFLQAPKRIAREYRRW